MGSTQVVILSLGEKEFGIRMENVNSIERPPELCRFPKLPAYIEGLAEIRGKVHTIVNLRKRLGFPEKARDEETRLIVLEACSSSIGLIADSVMEIITVDNKDIKVNTGSAGKRSMKPENKFSNDLVVLPDRTIQLLDPERLLLDD